MKFPYPCSRCGACCLLVLCPLAAAEGHKKPCPHLSFNKDIASCDIAGLIIPIGDGCCIKARA